MHPALKVFLFLLGIVLLLPGACGVVIALGIGLGLRFGEGDPGMVAVFAIPSILAWVGGIFLLLHVLRQKP